MKTDLKLKMIETKAKILWNKIISPPHSSRKCVVRTISYNAACIISAHNLFGCKADYKILNALLNDEVFEIENPDTVSGTVKTLIKIRKSTKWKAARKELHFHSWVATGEFHYNCLATISGNASIGGGKLGLTRTGFVKALHCWIIKVTPAGSIFVPPVPLEPGIWCLIFVFVRSKWSVYGTRSFSILTPG